MLLVTLLTVSTVNATDIMANGTLDDSKVQETSKQTSTIYSEDINSNKELTNDFEKTNSPKYDEISDTTKKQGTVNTLKTTNEDNVLSKNPTTKDVYNYAELLDLFSGQDKPGIKEENLIINLLGDNVYKINQTIDLRNGYSTVSSLKTLTINGNNKIIDGCGEYGFIMLKDSDSPLNLTLNNIIIKNCKSSIGSAIYIGKNAYANLTINNSVFENNHAKYAGAINFEGSSLKIINSNFTSNSANYNGGAIYIGDS